MGRTDYDDADVALEAWDIVIIVGHFLLVLGIGIWVSFNKSQS